MEDVDEPRLTVSGAARRLGIAPGTLRTWDRRYGIGPTDHTRGRHRLYSAADMARLELMQHALVQGASPAEAARYARAARPRRTARTAAVPTVAIPRPCRLLGRRSAPSRSWTRATALRRPRPTPTSVRSARGGGTLRMPGAGPRARGLGRAALAMDPVAVGALLEESIATEGLVATWNDVARPVLAAVGQRWATSGRGVEVEHLLSECLIAVFGARAAGLHRRAAAAGVPRPPAPARAARRHAHRDARRPAGRARRPARRARHRAAARSGPALPADALAAAVRRTAPAAVVLWSQLEPTADTAMIAALPVTRPRFRTYVAGPGWDGAALPAGVSRLASLTDAIERIGAAVLR